MIPPETLAQIKERTDIVALIGETVRLVRRGRSHVGLCPFHKEKSPSFHVHQERGFFHCFGCQESGSAIDFVMKTNGLEFLEAVKMLAERAGIQIQEVRGERAREQKSERDELYGVMTLAASFYASALGFGEGVTKENPLSHYGWQELEKRGKPKRGSQGEEAQRWEHALSAFKMGYAPASWDALSTFFREQGISPVLGERAGLLVPGQRGHYDRFRHRLMFAVIDAMGRVIAFSGRALPPPSSEELARISQGGRSAPSYDGEAPAKYINSPESAIYKKGEQLFGLFQAKQGMRQRGEAVLVEGNFDVVTLHARGVDHAVAPLGTAFTSEQAKLLKRFAPRVVIAFDGDAAGKKATRAARVPCQEGGLEARVAVLPEGTDPDDLVRTKGTAALLERLKDAQGMLEHLIQDALDGDRFGGAALSERVARVRAVTKLLSEEPDPDVRLMGKRFADQLSTKLIVGNAPARDLVQLERMVGEALRKPESNTGRKANATPQASLELAVLGAVLDFPALLHDPEVLERLSALTGDAALSIVAVRRGLLDTGESRPDIADFLATLPGSIQRFAAQRLALPNFEDVSEAKLELLENTAKLRDRGFQRQNSAARDELSRSPSSLDADSAALLREIEQRARAKRGLSD